MHTKRQAIAALKQAVSAYPGNTGPGCWRIDEDMGEASYSHGDGTRRLPQVGLTYEVAIGNQATGEDAPWRQWGGGAIIAAASLADHLGDGIATENGGMYYDTAIIAVLPDEEDQA